ncbi:MAG TPA: BTAD domain-containing putative transcriptional regulator [Gaiellaceae bacterium]
MAARTVNVSLELLGRFAVVIDGTSVDERAWRLRKARTLVKVLALTPGRRLHREQTMELLWPDLTATAAQNNLHQALHAARRVLGAESIALSDGLLVLSEHIGCDVDRFEREAAEARALGAAQAYESALRLYGGELLPEDRYESWSDARRAALRELHGTLCLELAERQQPDEAVHTLQRALAAAPLSEPAHRELMRLYVVLGRRQDALAQFNRLRDALRVELAAEPDEATRALYRELLAGESLAALQPPPLPMQLTSFVGRTRELREVLDLLERSRLLTLIGPGGSGKTRLGLAAAAQAGGAWLVELGSLFDPTLVAEAAATAVGIQVPSRRTAAEAVAEHIGERQALLVLDTCEHVVGACAALVETILRVCPNVRVLATSREPLRTPGETTWRVPGLGVPDPDAAELAEAEAVQLFVARARDADRSFALDETTAAHVAAICTRLDGMPLALELAAARASALSVAEIAARLVDSLEVLTAGNRTALTRQQTLRATIEWSHDLLGGEERVLFRRLAVFAGTFSLNAAEEVCAGGPIELRHVADLLARLVDKSLVIVDAGRYRLLDTIRQFAAERLGDAAEREAVEARLLDWAVALASAHDPDTQAGAQSRSLESLELDHDNVRAALDGGLRNDPQGALLLVTRFWRFWLDRNFFTEGTRRVRAALDAAPESTELRSRALLAAAALELRCGERQLFLDSGREADAIARRSGDRRHAADVGHRAGLLYVAGLSMNALDEVCAEALELAGDDHAVRASTLSASSLASFYLGDFADARRRLNAALEELGHVPSGTEPFFEGVTYGFAILPEGRDGVLRALLEETIMLFHRFAREPAIAYTLCNVATLERTIGRASEARAALEDALERFRALGNEGGEALALTVLGNTARTFGEPDVALEHFDAALVLRRRRGDRRAVAMTETDAALAIALAGDIDEARRRFAGLRDAFRAADDAPGQGGVLVSWSLAEEREGELEEAAELVRQGSEVWEPRLGGHLPGWSWLTAADLFAALGKDAAAERSVTRAEQVLTEAGDTRGLGLCAAHRAAKPAQRGG